MKRGTNIEKLKDLPDGIDGVRAIGKISKEGYEKVFVPLLDEARREGCRIRLLSAVSHRVLPDSGVIVVEVEQALRAQDFDALAFTADNWIETHGYLQGLVIHVHEFPGWENFGSFLRHVRFVRNHHREVKKIAFAADRKLASLAPEIAGLFIQAEVKSFGYDELDIAITWAARPATQRAASPQSASN